MKRFLKRRWHSIPVALVTAILVVCLLAGGVFAAYTVWTGQAETEVLESIEVYTADSVAADGSLLGAGWASLCYFPDTVWPGTDLGAKNLTAKYVIHNIGPIPITITVTMTEPAGMEYAGLSIVWSNGSADMLREAPEIVLCRADRERFLTHTFVIGAYDYLGAFEEGGISGGEVYDEAKGDSAWVKVYIDGKVAEDADPDIPLTSTITVERGE